MATCNTPTCHNSQDTSDRWRHRVTCVLAGGLAVTGGTLAFLVNPWFATVAMIGGVGLIMAPESKSCPTPIAVHKTAVTS